MKHPVIGVTFDFEDGAKGKYSLRDFYASRENHFSTVAVHGAAPIALPHEVEQVETYLSMIDGLMITGGNFDVPPEMYGQKSLSDTVMVKEKRTAFEWAITKGCLERNIPILGICGGQQLLNVILGGSLIQHIPDVVTSEIQHEQPNDRREPGHTVLVESDTLLHDIVQAAVIEVNSAHHQAVDAVPDGCVISGRAPDGVIEAIELPRERHPFCLGVQWHPEYSVAPTDVLIMKTFVEACGSTFE